MAASKIASTNQRSIAWAFRIYRIFREYASIYGTNGQLNRKVWVVSQAAVLQATFHYCNALSTLLQDSEGWCGRVIKIFDMVLMIKAAG